MVDNAANETSFSFYKDNNFESDSDESDIFKILIDLFTTRRPVGYAFEPVVCAATIESGSSASESHVPEQDVTANGTESRSNNTRWCRCGNCF